MPNFGLRALCPIRAESVKGKRMEAYRSKVAALKLWLLEAFLVVFSPAFLFGFAIGAMFCLHLVTVAFNNIPADAWKVTQIECPSGSKVPQ